MAEQQFIPTITVIEGIPPLIDIITFYEGLLGVPNILEGFIAAINGAESNGILFTYGELGVVMKNWPEFVDVDLHEGEFSVITPKLTDEPGDAENYFIDADGNLGYFFEEIPFSPTDFTEFEWGLDFGDSSSLTLTGDLINSITHITGSPQAGNWSATGTKRPTLTDGAAVLDGLDDELLASFVFDGVASDEIFIVAKKPVGVKSYFIASGRTWVFDGDAFMLGLSEDNKMLQYESNGSTGGDAQGILQYPDGEYQLYHWKYIGDPRDCRYNGFLDDPKHITSDGPWWFSTIGGDPLAQLTLGRKPSAGTQLYFPSSIKEILYFSSLTDEKRKCIEVYLKYKHDLPVYVNPYQFL